jgi:hypothetical protein
VLVGKERFSENHTWSEMPLHWSSDVADRAVIEVVGQGGLEARLVDGGPPVDVVVPMWSTHASWRPPTQPPSPATTSQPRADDSATPSPATSIISHPPDS